MTVEPLQTLYSETMAPLAVGDTTAARALLEQLKARATSPEDRVLVIEAEAWCLLCEGKPAQARDSTGSWTCSPLLLAVLGVVVGTSEGAGDVLAEAIKEMPSIGLLTHALVACGASAHLASLLERPAMVTRFSDAVLQASSERVFRAGVYDVCEKICLAAFRAFGAPVHLYNAACCASRIADVDRALDYLRRALEVGFSDRLQLANDPDLATVRADPRFAAL